MNSLTILSVVIIFSINSLSSTRHSQSLGFTTNEANDTLKKIAGEILNGRKIETVTETIIYQIIDSVLTHNPADRNFYFKVFTKINMQAKGDITAEIDWKIKDFCYKYPNDFFSISEVEIRDYAQRIGELIRTEEEYPKKAAKGYLDNIVKTSDKKYQKETNIFSRELIKKIK